jgi:hypothetical protein
MLDLEICGISLRIRGVPAELDARLADLVRPFVASEGSRRSTARDIDLYVAPGRYEGEWVVSQDGRVLREFLRARQLLAYLEWLAISRAIAATSRQVAFHAAALARGDAVVLLVGESGAGKTTLTLGLMRRGWEPFADDIALVDRETLAILAFPRCFHVEGPTTQLIDDGLRDVGLFERPGQLAGYARPRQWASGERRVTCVVVASRCPTGPSSRSAVTQAQVAGILAAATIDNQVGRSERIRMAVGVVAAARACIGLRNGHLDGALDLIEGAVRL